MMAATRWRTAVTVVGWLLVIQAGFGVVGGAFELALKPMLVPSEVNLASIPDLDELMPGHRDLPPLVGALGAAIWAGLGFNLALLGAAIGFLRRQKWGWYGVVVVHILAAGGLFMFLPTVFGGVLAVAAPGASPLLPWALSLLAVLPALALIGFLLLDPVVRQFEARREPPPPSA